MRAHIIFFGNELHGDDGFGPAVFNQLSQSEFSEGVYLYLAGTRGLDALALFQNCSRVILVDVMQPKGNPGRLHWLGAEDIHTEHTQGIAGHSAGVGHLLRCFAALEEPMPEVRVLAAEAEGEKQFHIGLSPEVSRSVADATRLLREWIEESEGVEQT